MAQAILLPLFNNEKLLPSQVLGIVGHDSSLKSLEKQLPRNVQLVVASNESAKKAWEAPTQLLAVKPQQLDSVVKSLNNIEFSSFAFKPLLISVVAGVTLSRLESSFPNHICVRAVPNTPCLVGSGLTGLAWGSGIENNHRLTVEELFSSTSEVFDLQEDLLDAFLALTSSGPAYISLILESLADGAVAAGLPRTLANHLANKTLTGSALLIKEKNLHPGELKDMVASPAGTTITALRHLEMAGIRSALIEAVVAAAERSRELA